MLHYFVELFLYLFEFNQIVLYGRKDQKVVLQRLSLKIKLLHI